MKTSASLRALLAASASVTVFAFTTPAMAADPSTEVGEGAGHRPEEVGKH